jgi:hypothetical protein
VALTMLAESDLALSISFKSVYVCGIDEKVIVADPPEPTVLDASNVNVFGIVAP